MFELLRYEAPNGYEPFTKWLEALQDKQAQTRLRIRVQRLESGLFGDWVSIGEGIVELREHHGAGFRIYLGRHRRTIVILICGGTKRTQASDIKKAREYWSEWKRRQT